MKRYVYLIILIFIVFMLVPNTFIVNAESLEETIKNELENINLGNIEDFFNSIINKPEGLNFQDLIQGFIDGTYVIDYNNIFSFIKDLFISNINAFLPSLTIIIVISIIYSLIIHLRGSVLSETIKGTVQIVFILTIIFILSRHVFSLYEISKNTIENVSKFNEILSPIIISLMVASGGKISASIFSPTVVFFSTGFINVIFTACLPLIILSTIFSCLSCLTNKIKMNKFADFFSSIFKWIIGLLITLSGLILTTQGLNASIIDGASIKVAKYTISNMVPIVGGFLKDGFDIVACGSIIIKNVLGITGLIGVLFIVLSPVLSLLCFSFILKFVSAIIEPFTDDKISSICLVFSKTITHFIACILAVGVMFFITILILIMSSSVFI